MKYSEWEMMVPEEIRHDSLWKMTVYRLGLFLSDLAWHDVIKLERRRLMHAVGDQMFRAVGSISANLAEGYSRGTGKDRARFYEYALGSARESRDWYFKARHVLGDEVVDHRIQLITEIIKLLLTMVPQQRDRLLRDQERAYETDVDA